MLDVNKMFGKPPVIDYEAHNKQVKEVWDTYHAGNPVRMPMILGVNPRIILCNPALNPDGITYEKYLNDPDLMIDVQLAFWYYFRHFYTTDNNMGDCGNDYGLFVDACNYYDAAYFGADIDYPENEVPVSHPFLNDDNKYEFISREINPDDNAFLQKLLKYHDYFREKAKTMEYRGCPVTIGNEPPMMGSDGPLTICCNIRGTTEFMLDLYDDTEFAMKLLEYVTDSLIARVLYLRKRYGLGVADSWGFADDSIALLSCKDYERFVLPMHKKLKAALSTGKERGGCHLCGDATRHFKMIQQELNIWDFDTGYPIDFAKVLRELGDVKINGGVKVDILTDCTPEQVYADTKRIIDIVKPLSKRFIMREANNLAPCTPVENIKAMYDAVLEHGRF